MWRAFIACALLLQQLQAQEPSSSITVPVEFQHGRILFSAHIGKVGPLTLLLDSGCTIPTLHPRVMDELNLSPSGRVRINGIAGIERAPTYRGVVFDFGSVDYAPPRLAVVPSERNERRRRDGVLDSGFFSRYVIEVRSSEKAVILHAPTNFAYKGSGEIIPFRFRDEIPVLHANLILPGRESLAVELELDTGCDSGLCLGKPFVEKHDLVSLVEGRSSEKVGIGGSVETRSVRLPAVRLGNAELKNVDTDLFLDGSPVDEPLAGHIGMAALGQRKVTFDYHRRRLIIE